MRIEKFRSNELELKRGNQVQIIIDNTVVTAFEGEMISTVLHVEGISKFQRKHKTRKPAGIYCGMGICYECLVTINGVQNIRACQTPVSEGMIITTGIEEKS